MTIDELGQVVPMLKSVSELGLGILGTITTIGISIYFVTSLAPLLKKLTVAVENVSETNKSVVTTLQSINTVLCVHDQRSQDMQAAVSVGLDKMTGMEKELIKVCTKIGC